jgi:hypothetical protein
VLKGVKKYFNFFLSPQKLVVTKKMCGDGSAWISVDQHGSAWIGMDQHGSAWISHKFSDGSAIN